MRRPVQLRMMCIVLLVLLFGQPHAQAAAWSRTVDTGTDSGVVIELSSMLETLSVHGYYPMRIHIRNLRSSAGTWSFIFKSTPSYDDATRLLHRREFSLPARDEKTFEVMIPVYPSMGELTYPRMTIQVFGSDIEPDMVHVSSHYRQGSGPFIGISETMAIRNKVEIESIINTQNFGMILSQVSLNELADDMRGYSGLDGLIMNVREWNQLGYHHHYAIKQWIALGGNLILAGSKEDRATVPVGLENGRGSWPDKWTFGWGRVWFMPLVNDSLDAEAAVKMLSVIPNYADQSANGYGSHNWLLRRAVPDIAQPLGLLLAAVLAIAMILGPINLFIAFRKKRHTQVLWTTPVISLVASVVLAVSIILMDGFGGYGYRAQAVFLLPDDQIQVVTQEQVCRTGVLLSRNFTLPSAAVILPVNTGKAVKRSMMYEVEADGQAGGSWFTSRSIQGHILQQSQPTRSRMELWWDQSGDSASPELFSAIDAPLAQVYVVDGSGTCWKAENLHAGESKPLQPVTRESFESWWKEMRSQGGGRLWSNINQTEKANNMFFAEAKEPQGTLLDSLPFIRWKDDKMMFMGYLKEVDRP